ncbi:MAG: molybdopterin-dependent oxidoreductase [Chloroflexi bacterium]|nr:molybdopterin-dependent oxidoreductase [Chloroflexota bacterium]
MTQSKIRQGTLVGAFTTAALMAIFYVAEQAADLPFPPFDIFQWISRILPGFLITFGIDRMIDVIRALNLGQTDDAAKLAEKMMAITLVLIIGAALGAIFFNYQTTDERHRKYSRILLPGAVMGLLVGVAVSFISDRYNFTSSVNNTLSGVWITVVFIVWGVILNWAYNRLTTPTPVPMTATPDMPEKSVQVLDRRRFLLILGGATASITVIGSGIGAYLNSMKEEVLVKITGANPKDFPNLNDKLVPVPGTRPEYTPLEDHYRIDINVSIPEVDLDTWKLAVGGLVENPTEFTLDDIRNNYEPTYQYITMSCISNRLGGDLISTTHWTGTSFQHILNEVKPKPEAKFARIESVDGFWEYLDLDLVRNDERIMLTYAWDGALLEAKHGFPLRIHIPNRYGMKQPKWITKIDFVEEWDAGYWVARGWDKDALIKATSVIDTVAVHDVYEQNGSKFVPVGGMAWAGPRGISKVEVQVDEGDWAEAELRQPLSDKTWVIWRYDWPFNEGDHTFHVRCTEGDGTPQITSTEGTRPSGASGIFKQEASL